MKLLLLNALFAPNGHVCLRWRQAFLLNLDHGDLAGALQCLEDVLERPTHAFSLGASEFCACRAADDHLYLVCHDRVVLRLRDEEARNLHTVLASAREELEKTGTVPRSRSVM